LDQDEGRCTSVVRGRADIVDRHESGQVRYPDLARQSRSRPAPEEAFLHGREPLRDLGTRTDHDPGRRDATIGLELRHGRDHRDRDHEVRPRTELEEDGPSLRPDIGGRRVLVIEDGPTITHGGMPFGAGTVAARQHGAGTIVDPRPWAVGSIADTFTRYPTIGTVLPAMGYSPAQLDELAATIRAVECDVVVTGTPVDLGRLIDVGHPVRHATYDLRELGHPDLADTLAPLIERALATAIREGRAPSPGPAR